MNHILLIDDDEISNLINERIIRNLGITKITACVSAFAALDFLNNALANDPVENPDIILLDISMPVMDGFEFLDEFYKLPPSVTQGVVIAFLTSSSGGYDKERSEKYVHVAGFLSKPLDEQKLRELITNSGVRAISVP